VLEVGGGDEDGVHILEVEKVLAVLERAGRTREHRLGFFHCALPVYLPQIADRGDFDLVTAFQIRCDGCQFAAAVADANVAEGDAIVRADDAAVGEGRSTQGGCTGEEETSPPYCFIGGGLGRLTGQTFHCVTPSNSQ
jgi:hypothetical protein